VYHPFSRFALLLTVIFAALPFTPLRAQEAAGPWPTIAGQLAEDGIDPDSALAALILENQDFRMLRAEEAKDTIGLPPWLRVYWRKAHPELTYSADDPTGGYPRVLNEIYEWMVHHQDLKRGPREADVAPGPKVALSISAGSTGARSESDIRIDYWHPTRIIAASNAIISGGAQAQYYSSNSGATWGRTTLPFFSGDTSHSDPTVDWTSDGTAWSTTIGVHSSSLSMRAYKSTDGGATWTADATFSGTQTSSDKQLIWADHSASSPFKDYLYAIWHNGNPAFMNRRSGPAGSWGTPIQVSGAESSGTCIGGDVTTNSAGVVFAFWPTTGNSKIFMVKSTDGGSTYSTPQLVAPTLDGYDIGVPSFANRRALIYVSVGAYKNVAAVKDNVYVSWTDLSGASGCTVPANEPGSSVSSTCKTRIWFTRSTNGGSTWETPRMVNNQSTRNDQFNQRLVVDETTGRLGIIYYDTANDAGRKKTDVFFQSSVDDGVTWTSAQRVTSGMTDETLAGSDSGNQYGDYNGLSGYNSTFFPTWTDRSASTQEQIWTNGTSTAACVAPATPAGLVAVGGQARVDLSWGAIAGVTEYHIYRATASGGPYAQAGASATTTFSDLNLATGPYYYVVRSGTTCESGNSNEASGTATAAPPPPSCTPVPVSCPYSATATLTTSSCTLGTRGTSNYTGIYSFNGTAGSVVTIDLTSSAFDTYLYLLTPSGAVATFNDDFSGTNSHISYTLTTSGIWTIEATSYGVGVTGSYTLAVTGCGSSGKQFDFDGDLKSDLFWRNKVTGANAIWLMNGTTATNTTTTTVADLNWKPMAFGDFDGNGKADVVWRNTATAAMAIWLMNGATVVTNASVASPPSLDWVVAGVGDFDGNGKADILWRNTVTGDVAQWLMNGATVVTNTVMSAHPSLDWVVAAVGDYSGDLKADVLWRSASAGTVAMWTMNGTTIVTNVIMSATPSADWTAIASGDFDGNGKADVLWRSASTGGVAEWLMNGSTIATNTILSAHPSADWTAGSVGDFDGDNRADIAWRNTSGANAVWLMSGTTISTNTSLTSIPDTNWELIKSK
jgi:hypothetical protein